MRTGRSAVSDGPRTVSSSSGSLRVVADERIGEPRRARVDRARLRHAEAPAHVAPAVDDEVEQARLVHAQDRALGLGRQQRARRRVGRHLAVLGLEAHGVAERDQERLLAPGVVDGAQRVAEQLPAAGPGDRVDARLQAGHRDRVGRHERARRRVPRHAQALVEHAQEREAGRGADGEDLVVAPAVQVDQLVAREPGRLADGGEVLAVVAHGHAHEVPADVPAARAGRREVAGQPRRRSPLARRGARRTPRRASCTRAARRSRPGCRSSSRRRPTRWISSLTARSMRSPRRT